MAQIMAKPQAGPPAQAAEGQGRLLPLAIMLFFAWGFCTVLVDTLIPKLKSAFSLSYAEVMLTQFSFFLAYFVFSIPAGWVLSRVGYLRAIVVGLSVMALGCLLFTPAAYAGFYPGFLGALFILAAGITVLQVAANPLAANLGDPARSHSRLTLAQAFNSLGTTVGPFFGAALILGGGLETPDLASMTPEAIAQFRHAEARALQLPFTIIAGVLIGLAALWWRLRRSPAPAVEAVQGGAFGRVLRRPRVSLGVASIFLYVGAEVAIGSTLVSFLMMDTTLGASARNAGNLIAVYWGLAMVGRFIGAYVLRLVAAGTVLCGCAIAAAALAGSATMLQGTAAAVAVLSVGLFNSIMFPTIFSLSIEDLGTDAASASSLLCLAIVGGAIVPLVTGFAADHIGLSLAFAVPAACYLGIALYGALARSGVLDRRNR